MPSGPTASSIKCTHRHEHWIWVAHATLFMRLEQGALQSGRAWLNHVRLPQCLAGLCFGTWDSFTPWSARTILSWRSVFNHTRTWMNSEPYKGKEEGNGTEICWVSKKYQTQCRATCLHPFCSQRNSVNGLLHYGTEEENEVGKWRWLILPRSCAQSTGELGLNPASALWGLLRILWRIMEELCAIYYKLCKR